MDPEKQKKEEEDFEIHPDHECSICLNVYYHPLKFNKCGHSFCRPCVSALLKTQQPKCPLCRAPVLSNEVVDNKELADLVQGWYPEMIEKRKKEEYRDVRIVVGNRARKAYQKEGRDFYEWLLYVEMEGGGSLDNYAKDIIVHLHPTFNPPAVRFLGNEPVRVQRVGWGIFTIKVTIYWKDEYGGHSDLEYSLSWHPNKFKVYTCKL